MTGKPIYATAVTVVCIVAAVVLVLFADPENQGTITVIGLIVSTLPSLIASFFAERTSRDVRNGVLVDKVAEGTAQAIKSEGVVVRDGPVVSAELRALSALLQQNTRITKENTAHLIEVDGGEGDGK
jgi:hypothetical protein